MTDTPQKPTHRRPPMGPGDRLVVQVPPAMLDDLQAVATLRWCTMTDLIRLKLAFVADSLPGPGYIPKPMKPPAYTRPGWQDKATAQIQMRLPRVLLDALDAIATASSVSRSTMVRWLIADCVESTYQTIDIMTAMGIHEKS